MKKNTRLTLLMVAITLAPIIYLAIAWPSIPATIALHFNQDMQPDRMGDKTELWLPVLIIAFAGVFTYFLLRNIARFDPKQKNAGSTATFSKLATGVLVFMSVLNFMIILSAVRGSFVLEKFLFPLLGLLLAFIGNYMNSIRPNYFAGIRLPWTLSSDENWRKTHHLAGRIWFACGLLLVLLGMILPLKTLLPIFICMICIMVLVPAVYSYRIFKKNNA